MTITTLQTNFVCYCMEGIKFVNQQTLINLILTHDGIEILEKTKQVLFIPYTEILDVKVIEEDKKELLEIKTAENTIKIYKVIAGSVKTLKEMIVECLKNKDEFFVNYDKQAKEMEQFNKKCLNIFLWFLGICFLFSIFTIKDELFSSICSFCAGLLILPPSYNAIKERFQQLYTKKVRIWSIIGFFVLSTMLKPQTTTAYIKAPDTIICKKAQSNTGFKKMNTLEEINVYKDSYKTNGFLKTSDGDWIKEDAIVYKNTQEYKDIAAAEEKKKQEIEKAKQEIEKLLKEQQAKLEKELKSRIDKAFVYYDITEYSYVYYANPIAWYSTNVKEKENIMQNCATYGRMVTKQEEKEMEMALSRTKIKSSANGAVLGEYSIWSGYKFQ
ncbi:MAG: hypothetical protein NC200_03215 [Candidatus Gastranaerophilales bacterium]|nr:hypothetical protein [Candidatus Gastranaerophilales bacterium]